MVVCDRNALEQASVEKEGLHFKGKGGKGVSPETQEQEAARLPGLLEMRADVL